MGNISNVKATNMLGVEAEFWKIILFLARQIVSMYTVKAAETELQRYSFPSY